MNGWLIFLVIALVLGVIVSNLLLLKHSAKIKIPGSVIKAVAERNQREADEKQITSSKKKPTDN